MVITCRKLISFCIQLSDALARERGAANGLHTLTQTRVPYARVYDTRRIRNELFAKFMQICMDCAKVVRDKSETEKEGGRNECARSVHVINIHELQRAILSSFFSSRFLRPRRVVPLYDFFFLPLDFGVAFREDEILSPSATRLARMLKADNEAAMNTNRVRRLSRLYTRMRRIHGLLARLVSSLARKTTSYRPRQLLLRAQPDCVEPLI